VLGSALVAFATAAIDPRPTRAATWTEIAQVGDARAARLFAEARALVAGDRLAEAETRLHEARAARPGDPGVALALADVQLGLRREQDAVATLERALARFGDGEPSLVAIRLGAVYAKLGRFREAAALYAALTAGGAAPAEVYANFGEMLMGDGRLADAAARYRDAIAVASNEITGERRPRSQDLALAYYGLAVALDRDQQPAAAREAMARALVHDPGAALLKQAMVGDGEVVFEPTGEAFYYLGLAAELEGRGTDAEAAFREFIARLPKSRWASRAAAHADGATAARAKARGARSGAGRVIAIGTLETSGGIAAPLIDAAWRDHAGLLDACLDGQGWHGTVRVTLELEIDASGRVTRARARTVAPFDGTFARCAEAAVESKLRVAVSRGSKPTTARTDVVIAFP